MTLTIVKTFDTNTGTRAAPGSAFGVPADPVLANNYFNAVDEACTLIQNNFCSAKTRTIEIQFGYGTINNQSIPVGDAAHSSYFANTYTYAAFRAAVIANAVSANAIAAAATLPASPDPTSSGVPPGVAVTQALDKMLGSQYSGLDGYVGIKQGTMFWTQAGGAGTGYDAVGLMIHEITEVMSRAGAKQNFVRDWASADLYAYTGIGVRTNQLGGFFSIDGGQTNLGSFNSNSAEDSRDWAALSSPNGVDACNANVSQNVLNELTTRDTTIMDAMGWQFVTASSPPVCSSNPAISGITKTGNALSVSNGTWTNSPAFTYQWKKDGAVIVGATSNTYAPKNSDRDSMFTCDVTGTNASGSATASAPAVGPWLTNTKGHFSLHR